MVGEAFFQVAETGRHRTPQSPLWQRKQGFVAMVTPVCMCFFFFFFCLCKGGTPVPVLTCPKAVLFK